MRIAFDTNVIAYAEGVNDADRRATALGLITALRDHDLVLPLQVAGELFRVLTTKMKRSPPEARAIVADWQGLLPQHPGTTPPMFAAAMDLAAEHRLQIWDALIVSAAAEAGCRLLLSEDMADGFVWRGLTIVDPFKRERHPLLADALR